MAKQQKQGFLKNLLTTDQTLCDHEGKKEPVGSCTFPWRYLHTYKTKTSSLADTVENINRRIKRVHQAAMLSIIHLSFVNFQDHLNNGTLQCQ